VSKCDNSSTSKRDKRLPENYRFGAIGIAGCLLTWKNMGKPRVGCR